MAQYLVSNRDASSPDLSAAKKLLLFIQHVGSFGIYPDASRGTNYPGASKDAIYTDASWETIFFPYFDVNMADFRAFCQGLTTN